MSVRDGYLQNPCISEVTGGNEMSLWDTLVNCGYSRLFENREMPETAFANSNWLLRQADGRPLSWADSDDSEMLIDPTVGNIAGGQGTSHPST